MLPAVDGEYVKIVDAAHRLGLSVDTVRRRIRRGELDAVRMPTRSGSTWHVWMETVEKPTTGRGRPTALQTDEEQGPTWRRELGDLVLLVSRLQAENRELATRVGYLEAELAHARSRTRMLEEELQVTERTPIMILR